MGIGEKFPSLVVLTDAARVAGSVGLITYVPISNEENSPTRKNRPSSTFTPFLATSPSVG